MTMDQFADGSGSNVLLVILAPGFLLFPLAVIISIGHLVWSLQPGRREWVLSRFVGTLGKAGPTTKERRHIAGVTRAMAMLAFVSPGIYIVLPPFTFLPVFAVLVYRYATAMEKGAHREIRRSKPVSVSVLAWMGFCCGIVAIAFYWIWGPKNEPGMYVLYLLLVVGGLGFISGSRQITWIHSHDLEDQLSPISLEDLHAYPNR